MSLKKINYLTSKELNNKYPQGGYEMIGVNIKGVKENVGTYQYKGKHNKLYYKIIGYIDCGNNQYIEVLKDQRKERLIQLVICIFMVCIFIVSLMLD